MIIFYILATGLDKETIKTRVLKYTYGIGSYREWNPKIDDQSRRTQDGRCQYFELVATRGTPEVEVNQQLFTCIYCVSNDQTKVEVPVYYTKKYDAKYCDEADVRLFAEMKIGKFFR